ncbi:hypothetical protein [Pseudomonas sp. v388]|uniref:hypothetical protein n=1 Tax=Pseudomonas sp. v388 TaxID=2479849 RepID=UPI000F7B37E0|nr:hypothetical protein [Pseudomonas sp. v388]
MAVAIVASFCSAASFSQTFSSYEDVALSSLPENVLWHVIARDGKSKNYSDLLPLDGGTVGIAHFAKGGLNALYDNMDTNKYFGKDGATMRQQYSTTCRPAGKKGDDTGWGCYSQKWWNEGMRKFLETNESKDIQHRAWAQLMKPVIKDALAHKWQSGRQLAIALLIANSLGAAGFNRLATKEQWDAEKSLNAYAQTSDHTKRRRDALNQTYP